MQKCKKMQKCKSIAMSTINIAGCGDASDRARFRNYAASRIPMTNAIGVAKTIIANRPIASDAPQAPHKPPLDSCHIRGL